MFWFRKKYCITSMFFRAWIRITQWPLREASKYVFESHKQTITSKTSLSRLYQPLLGDAGRAVLPNTRYRFQGVDSEVKSSSPCQWRTADWIETGPHWTVNSYAVVSVGDFIISVDTNHYKLCDLSYLRLNLLFIR